MEKLILESAEPEATERAVSKTMLGNLK